MKQQAKSPVNLKDVPLFQNLSSDELRTLKMYLREKEFKKGELLALEGNLCERIFIVQYGRVKLFRTAVSGREQILEILEAGNTCACNPGSAHWTCGASVQAMADTRVWIMPRDYYIRMLQNNSRLAQALTRLFAERLCRFSSLIEEVSLNDTKKRMVKFLIDMQNNSISTRSEKNLIAIPFTREQIAQRIGTTRETVTRHLKYLKRLKLIDIHPHQISICNKEGLQKLLAK